MKIYLISYLALIILLGLTVLMANLHFGKWALTICLVIAALKAFIIVMFFMHAAKARNYSFVIAGLLLFLLAVSLLALSDFRMRIGNGG